MEECLEWKVWEVWELTEGLAALVSIRVSHYGKASLTHALDFSKLGGGAGGDMPDLGDMGGDEDDDDDDMPALEGDDEAATTGDAKGKGPEKTEGVPATSSKIEEVS